MDSSQNRDLPIDWQHGGTEPDPSIRDGYQKGRYFPMWHLMKGVWRQKLAEAALGRVADALKPR